MASDGFSRRRLLGGVSVAGVTGLAGCLGALFGESSSYACTDIDDGPTREYSDTLLPFTFEAPEAMSEEEAFEGETSAEVELAKRWSERNPGSGRSTLNHAVSLTLTYVSGNREYKPSMFRGMDPGTVIGKRVIDGVRVGIIQRDASETGVRLGMWFPATVDGTRVFHEARFVIDARLQGSYQAEEDARSNDPDQTCRAAVQTVVEDVVDSVPAISPAESETTLGISAASGSVRRGESVDLTVEAAGVDWVDVLAEGPEFDFNGTLAVGEAPVTLTMAPRTDEGGADVITADDAQLHTSDSIGETKPGSYTVVVRGPGDDGAVSTSTSLTVEPAN